MSRALMLFLLVVPCFTSAQFASCLPPSQFQHSKTFTLTPDFEASYTPLPTPLLERIIKFSKSKNFENNTRKIRITAAILAVTLGPFGVHRLYLGTSPIVPAVYVATVGGGVGILPFIDLIAILFTKDITPYLNNKKIFMWAN